MSQTTQVTISQHFANPNVSKFLDDQLKEKKGEFVSNVIALTNNNPKLAKCAPADLMMCAMNATALGLPLNNNLGFAYVIPYENRRANIVEPQFQIGYKGLTQLAIRTGLYKTINTTEVREGEIDRNKFTGEVKILGEFNENEVVGYLAYLRLTNGFEQSLFMSVDDIEAHADKFSAAFHIDSYRLLLDGKVEKKDQWKYSSPWYTDFDGMSKKTVLKLLLGKYGVLSTEIQRAIVVDQQIGGEYKDNPQTFDPIVDITEKKEKMKEGQKTEEPLP